MSDKEESSGEYAKDKAASQRVIYALTGEIRGLVRDTGKFSDDELLAILGVLAGVKDLTISLLEARK